MNGHSPLLIPADRWQLLRRQVHRPAFAAALAQLRQDSAAFLAQPLTVPTEPAGHYHHYFCPYHGVELIFDPASPHTHRCPVDGAQLHGPRYDEAWRWFVNNRLSQSALQLAARWQLEGDPTHAARVAEILTGYAAHYAAYAAAPRSSPNTGIATHQTLDEAVWILPLTWAFDLTRGTMDAQRAALIENQLLAPVAEFLIRRHHNSIHNFACWHNAAIATIGTVLGRQEWVALAVNGTFGLESQLRDGVLADGLWFEGSFSYHFYTLAAILLQLKATAQSPEFDRRAHPAVRAMFDAPIRCQFPDGTLPATNDCWYFTGLIRDCCHGVPPAPAFYELGLAWTGDLRYAQVLRRAYSQGPRDSLDALLYGLETIPEAAPPPASSVELPASGYAVLRPASSPGPSREPARQPYILLKYGPHGGGHGHPDKLNLLLFGHGQRLSVDLGTPGYGFELFESWYRQTVSHNCLTVDGRSQPPASGELVHFQGQGPFQVADARVAWTEGDYGGVSMRRVILARPDYFLDICLVTCDRPRQIDWIFHGAGTLQCSLPLTEQPDRLAGDGYGHLEEVRQVESVADFACRWLAGPAGLRLWAAGAQATQILAASSPGNPATERRSTLISRRHAQATAYLACIHPCGREERIAAVEWSSGHLLEEGWAGCTVRGGSGSERWLIRLTEHAAEQTAELPAYAYTLGAV